MAKGESGRVVVEIEPAIKRQLYSALAMEGLTLKDWFLKSANQYLQASSRSTDDAAKVGVE